MFACDSGGAAGNLEEARKRDLPVGGLVAPADDGRDGGPLCLELLREPGADGGAGR